EASQPRTTRHRRGGKGYGMLPPRGARARRASVEAAVPDGQRSDACRHLGGGVARLQQGSRDAARALRAHPGLVRSRNRAAGVAADGAGTGAGGGLGRPRKKLVGWAKALARLFTEKSLSCAVPTSSIYADRTIVGGHGAR